MDRRFFHGFLRFPAFSIALILLLGAERQAGAFALLGPYSDWMDVTNGFRQAGDIGGPMNIQEGYRWNVPTLTYGFDASFLEYFGSNGVRAVEKAIGQLNALPPASELVLTNFPLFTMRENFLAEQNGWYDLQSVTLAALIEQLGLAQPSRYVFALRQWDPGLLSHVSPDQGFALGDFPGLIVDRNFDPETLTPTNTVNRVAYSGYVQLFGSLSNSIPARVAIQTFTINPLDNGFGAVADDSILVGAPGTPLGSTGPGRFYTGLTFDDAGGLRYLLSTNHTVFETLLPGVQSATTTPLVEAAVRPGVDKLVFVPHPFDTQAGRFAVITNQYSDAYLLNGQLQHQQVERVISRPDFLFSAADTGEGTALPDWLLRTGTSNWINQAMSNGNPGGAGPGIIQPPITFTFHKLGLYLQTTEPRSEDSLFAEDQSWGSFDGSTNQPIKYPDLAVGTAGPLLVHLRLFRSPSESFPQSYTWRVPSILDGTALLQTSTNLSQWDSLYTVTNRGAVVEWTHTGLSQSTRFFRVVPQ